jgi:O-glycosyl hydrolase
MTSQFVESLESRQLLSTTSSASISVNTSDTYQTIRGMGGSIAKNARFDGAGVSDQNTAYALANLGISSVRVAINLSAWMPKQPTSTSTSSINWSQFTQSTNTTKEFKQLQGFQKSGMLIVASIFDGPNWLVTDPQDKQHRTIDPKKYADMAYGIATWLLRAKQSYGITISNISVNESNAGYNLRFSKYIMEDFLAIAGPMFAKMGLGYVKWDIGDDGFVGVDTFVKPILEDKAIAQYLGPIAWHTWNLDNNSDSAFTALANIAKQYGKEIWATEVGYDPLIQFNDPQAFTTFGNAIEDAQMYLRSLKVLHCTVMDYWDFANDFPLVNPTNNQPYPDYYIIQSYQQNLKVGAVIVQANSSDSSILSIAAKDTKNNHFFAQAIDDHTSGSQTVTFTGLPNEPLTLTQSDSKENGKVIGTYTPTGGKLTLTLPANSVNTLSGKFTGSSSSSSVKKAVATPQSFADSSNDSKSKLVADVLD